MKRAVATALFYHNSSFFIIHYSFFILHFYLLHDLGHNALAVVAKRGLAYRLDLWNGVFGTKSKIGCCQHGKVVFLITARNYKQLVTGAHTVQLTQSLNARRLTAALGRQL